MSENSCAGSAGVRINELARDNTMAEEGLAIREVGVRLASVGGGVEPARGGQYGVEDLELGRTSRPG